MDDFARLGVSPNASPKELQRARRVLAKVHHPDSAADPKAATKILSEINASYDRILAGNPIREKTSPRPTSAKTESTRTSSNPMKSEDFPNFDDPAEKPTYRKEKAGPSYSSSAERKSASSEQGPSPDVKEAQSESERAPKRRPYQNVKEYTPSRDRQPHSNREERVAAAAYAMAQKAASNKTLRPSRGLDITV